MATAQPNLFAALLIALACGWAARRILLRRPDVFACLSLGVAGAMLGTLAAQAAGLAIASAVELAAAALGGAVVIQALLVLAKQR